ncbi:potassium-transporting ATPase subunit KdpC [Acidithiobacillus acidisediminis]|jgi:K+-transporting ATPase ATPase C chain|uniref:potassium-transporting ATPase subunit KdpC n=1 Tax=Acidithiobacillus TaxID=119977 RepID=UPI00200C8364|nr:potassium-transporting ATPase subunit KdpC [Acidithiobacillus sp. S30A2]
MWQSLRQTVMTFLLLGLCVGVAYPTLMTALSQLLFPQQANGSLIREHGKVVGSALIGQYFTSPQYFWGRPSATDPVPYDAANSGASNLGPSNPVLFRHIAQRVAYLRKMDPAEGQRPVPVDLVTSSFSGLDPDISIAAAQYQVARVAAAGHLPIKEVADLVHQYTHWPLLPFIGEPVVRVLPLNLALQRAYQQRHGK